MTHWPLVFCHCLPVSVHCDRIGCKRLLWCPLWRQNRIRKDKEKEEEGRERERGRKKPYSSILHGLACQKIDNLCSVLIHYQALGACDRSRCLSCYENLPSSALSGETSGPPKAWSPGVGTAGRLQGPGEDPPCHGDSALQLSSPFSLALRLSSPVPQSLLCGSLLRGPRPEPTLDWHPGTVRRGASSLWVSCLGDFVREILWSTFRKSSVLISAMAFYILDSLLTINFYHCSFNIFNTRVIVFWIIFHLILLDFP